MKKSTGLLLSSSLLKTVDAAAGVCVESGVDSALIAAFTSGSGRSRSVTGFLSESIVYNAPDALPQLTGLVRAAGAIAPRLTKNKAVNLSLPDIIAKTSILEFDELPQSAAEASEVVSWKAAKGLFMKPSDVSVGFQRLPSSDSHIRVLASAIKREHAEFFEDAFYGLGIVVPRISLNSFDLFNAIRGSFGVEGRTVLIVRSRGWFSFIGVCAGELDFYRCKEFDSESSFTSEVESTFTYYGVKTGGAMPQIVHYLADSSSIVEPLNLPKGMELRMLEAAKFLPGVIASEAGKVSSMSALIAFGAAMS